MIVQIHTRVSSDEELQVVGQGIKEMEAGTNRLRLFWTVRPVSRGRLAAGGTTVAEERKARVGNQASSTLRDRAARRVRRRQAPAGGAAAPWFHPCRGAPPASQLPGPGPRRGWGRWGRKGASASVR